MPEKFHYNRTKTKWHFARRPVYNFYHITLFSSLNEKCFRQICTGIQNTNVMFNNFFSENRAVYEIIRKNTVIPRITSDPANEFFG